MMEGAYKSGSIYAIYAPENVLMAIGSRKFKAGPDTRLYTYEYHDIVDKLPDIDTLIDIVASVRKDGMGNSPKDKFGFNVSTHLANIPSDNTWQDTWEE